MKRLIFFGFIVLTCSCKNTWEESDKDAWKEACKENAVKWAASETKARTYCDCVLEKMMNKYPHENDALEHLDEFIKDSTVQACKAAAMKN